MTKMYKLTGDTKFLDKLYDNLLTTDEIMLDKETNLYFRDGKYVYPKHKSANGKKDFWARGDGWVLAGLAKVLQDMPKDYKHYPFFSYGGSSLWGFTILLFIFLRIDAGRNLIRNQNLQTCLQKQT